MPTNLTTGAMRRAGSVISLASALVSACSAPSEALDAATPVDVNRRDEFNALMNRLARVSAANGMGIPNVHSATYYSVPYMTYAQRTAIAAVAAEKLRMQHVPAYSRADLACLYVATTIDGNANYAVLLDIIKLGAGVRSVVALGIAKARGLDAGSVTDAIVAADFCRNGTNLASVATGPGSAVAVPTAIDCETEFAAAYVTLGSNGEGSPKHLSTAIKRVLRQGQKDEVLEAAQAAARWRLGDQEMLARMIDSVTRDAPEATVLRRRCAALLDD